MIFMIKVWLEWAEYISIFLTFVALIVSFSSNSNSFFFLGITVTIILNVINRWRLEERTKARIAGTLNVQIRRFSAEIEEIKQKVELYINQQKKIVLPPKLMSNISQSDDKIIPSLQEDLENLHQSLLTVINYLKEEKIELRIKNLEVLYESLQSGRKNAPESLANIKLPDKNILSKSTNFDLQPLNKIAWKCIHIINGHNESVTDLAVTNDNQYLLSTSWDNYLKLWSLEQGREVTSIVASKEGITTLAISDNDYFNGGIITGSLEQEITTWSLNQDSLEFSLIHCLQEHTGSIHGLAVASQHKVIVSGSFDQSLKQWDLKTGNLLSNSLNENGGVNAIAMNESLGLIVTGGADGIITMWQLNGEKELGILIGNSSLIECVAISHSGEFIIGGCANGEIKIWRLPTTTLSVFLEVAPDLELSAHNGQVMNVLLSSDDQLLYSAGVDGFIKIWHFGTAEEIGHLKISEDESILSLSLSNDDRTLVAGGVNGTIKIWQQNKV